MPNMHRKTLLIGVSIAILAAIIVTGAFAFLITPHVLRNPEAPAELREESLAFVRDVIGLNLTEYKVVEFNFWPQDCSVSKNGPVYLVRYNLKSASDEANVDIFYAKSNGTYMHESYFDMQSHALFAPAYPGDIVLNWTRDFIARYTNYRHNPSYLQEIQRTLETVNHIEPMNKTNSGITLQITIKQFNEEEIYTTLQFRQANQTAHDYDNAVTLEFHNGVWFNFADNIG